MIVVPRITSPNNFFTNIVSLTRSSRLEFDITTKSACGKWIVREAAQPFWRRQGLGEHLVHYLEHWVVFVGKRFWSCRIGSPISFLFSTKTGEIRQWNRKLMKVCYSGSTGSNVGGVDLIMEGHVVHLNEGLRWCPT